MEVWRPKLFAAHVSHGAFSPDGRWIAVACADRTAALYATESGRRLGAELHHDQPVWAIQISPDGRRLLVAGQERLWRLWDVSSLRNQMAAPLIGLAHNQTDFTPPAWHVRTNLMLREPPLDHLPICISPDGRRYLAAVPADPNTSFDLRRSADGAVIGETVRTQGSLSWAGFSPDGNMVVTLTLGGEARLWDTHTGAPLAPAMHHVHPLRWSAFSPDGSLLATGSGSFASGEGEARVWDARTGEPRTPWLPVEGHVQQVAFSPDGRWLVTTSSCEERRPHAARLWDPDTGLPVGQPMQHEDGVSSVAFSPDGRWIATGGDEGVIKVWTADGSGPVAGRLFHRRGVGHLGFTADGLLLGTASVDGTARFWDWRTGQPVGPPFVAPHSAFNFAMSPDQSELLLNSTERKVWFYRMNPDTRPVEELERLIRFMAGATIDEVGHRAPLSTRELLELGLGFADLSDAKP